MESHESAGLDIVGPRLWARFVLGGEGPALTLAEAAAVLGVSVSTVRRLISDGRVFARREDSGAYRVIPIFVGAAAQPTDLNTRLMRELESVLVRTEKVQRERDELKVKLIESAEVAAAAQQEIATLWRRLARQDGAVYEERIEKFVASAGSDKVRSVIIDAREVFKRRRHRFLLVG